MIPMATSPVCISGMSGGLKYEHYLQPSKDYAG